MRKIIFILAHLCSFAAFAQTYIYDVNSDEKESDDDIKALVDYIVDNECKQNYNYDVNGDSNYNIEDITALINHLCGNFNKGEHGYVDLGLPSGTLWATCNIGADNPEDYGDYFAWGETTGYKSGKTNFDPSTYKWCNGSQTTITKYCNDSSCGTVDDKSTLDDEDDAAYVNWGSDWHMPSQEQILELQKYTTSVWTTLNGVYGRIVTSKNNGNSIFLPAGGFYSGTSRVKITSGYFWSNQVSLTLETQYFATDFFYENWYSGITWGEYGRWLGYSIRPVRKK